MESYPSIKCQTRAWGRKGCLRFRFEGFWETGNASGIWNVRNQEKGTRCPFNIFGKRNQKQLLSTQNNIKSKFKRYRYQYYKINSIKIIHYVLYSVYLWNISTDNGWGARIPWFTNHSIIIKIKTRDWIFVGVIITASPSCLSLSHPPEAKMFTAKYTLGGRLELREVNGSLSRNLCVI